MEREEESLNLPLAHFQEASPLASLPMNSPTLPSIGVRKSINWARPLATSMQKESVNRISTRLSGKLLTLTDGGCSGPIEADKNGREIVQSSEKERPIRVISGARRSGRKLCKELEAAPTEPQESNCSLIQEVPKSPARKKARIIRGGESGDQLDRNVNIQAAKGWISVPLDAMEDDLNDCKAQDCMNAEAKEADCLRRPNNDATRTAEVHRNLASCSLNTTWHESTRHSKKKAAEEKHDTPYKELCKVLGGFKKVVHNVEHLVHELRENQMTALRKENTRIVDMAALEREGLHNEISELLQTNSRILEERLAIERDMDSLRKDVTQQLEASRESLRLELENQHAEILGALSKELVEEQDKNICQICFTDARDAIILPCMHFQYCSICVRDLKECPTCRTKISGVLRCNLCTS